MKDSSIKIKSYTKERIKKHCSLLNFTQNELIELLLDIGEKNNFSNENLFHQIKKHTTAETNRIIGFLKTQDKMINQNSANIETAYKGIINNSEISTEELISKINRISKILIDMHNENAL